MSNQNRIDLRTKSRYKMILVGDTAVGKSSIVLTMRGLTINPNNPPASTIGASFTTIKLDTNTNADTNTINCWDTAGQERYFSLIDIYFKDADIVFFVYDTTRPDTLESIFTRWYPRYLDCRKKYGQMQRYPSLLFLIGNKADTPEDRKQAINDPIFQSKQQDINLNKMRHFVVSALTQDNIDLLKTELTNLLKPGTSIAQYKHNLTINSPETIEIKPPSTFRESIQRYNPTKACCYN